MTDTTSTTQDPAEIERDIRRTQDEMSRTVDRIGDQLTPRNLINSLLDKAEDNNIDARYLLDGARRNPIALAMIAGGAIWLASDSDAKLPKFGSGSSTTADKHHDPFHRDYIAHMERLQPQDGEDDLAYQRRRDEHRGNYFMLDRGHAEDDHSFRERLNEAADRFRRKRKGWADSTRRTGSSLGTRTRNTGNSVLDSAREASGSLRETSSAAIDRTQDAFASNPLIGGLIAAAIGAIAGTAVPLTRTENENLSGLGESARDMLGEQKDKLVQTAREKKDDLIAQVQDAGSSEQGTSGTTSIPAYSATSPEPVS